MPNTLTGTKFDLVVTPGRIHLLTSLAKCKELTSTLISIPGRV